MPDTAIQRPKYGQPWGSVSADRLQRRSAAASTSGLRPSGPPITNPGCSAAVIQPSSKVASLRVDQPVRPHRGRYRRAPRGTAASSFFALLVAAALSARLLSTDVPACTATAPGRRIALRSGKRSLHPVGLPATRRDNAELHVRESHRAAGHSCFGREISQSFSIS